MSIFFHIMAYNVIPIFILVILGFVLGKKFNLNINTLSKLNFYLFVPGFVFYNIYTTELNLGMLKIVLFCILCMITAAVLSKGAAKIRGYERGMENAFKNSITFNNTGNIGVSLITLIFGSAPFIINGQKPYLSQALAAQIIVLVFTNITMNTLGFFYAGSAKMKAKDSIKQIFSMPSVYTIPLALLLKYVHFDMESTPLWPAIEYMKEGLVPISLVTLGVQLSKTKFDFRSLDVHIAVFTRLILGPVLAVIFIHLLGFTGVVAQVLLISYSVPTAVNTAMIAVECNNHQDFASQVVVISTVFSAVTLSLAVLAARIIFPV